MNLEAVEIKDKSLFRVEESFRTDIDLVELIDDIFRERLSAFGWEEEAINLGVGFHEALVNAVAHGNMGIEKPKDSTEDIGIIAKRVQGEHPELAKKKVFITTEISEKRVRVVIRDEGQGFEPKKVADPTSEEGLFKAEGRGLLFMRSYFDTVTYNKKRREVELIKERK